MTKHEQSFKAADSYHMDTNPISYKAKPDLNVSNSGGDHVHYKTHLLRFDRNQLQ